MRKVTPDPAEVPLAIQEAEPSTSQTVATRDDARPTILSPSDLVDLATDDDVCPCRGLDLQGKIERLKKALLLLSSVVVVLAIKVFFA
jgi:hypothetical protein